MLAVTATPCVLRRSSLVPSRASSENPSLSFSIRKRTLFPVAKPSLLLISATSDSSQFDHPTSSDALEFDSDPEPDESVSDRGIEIEVKKVGRNKRMVQARVGVAADLETVWGVLTDYEGLADFIPGLAVSQLIEKGEKFARLYQVGEQDLALGLKFNAKGVLDCYEKDLELLTSSRKRDIEFRMVDGDFLTFEGIWSIVQTINTGGGRDLLVEQEFQTILSYVVELEPKLWLPVRLIEGRLCREVKTNLLCIRDEAQRIQKEGLSAIALPTC